MKANCPFIVPEHVPTGLIRDYVFHEQAEVARDPYLANLEVFKLPDVFYSPAGNFDQGGAGTWVISRAELLREIYLSPKAFSSRNCLGTLKLVGMDTPVIPSETDPPEHTGYRLILNRFFQPARLNALEGYVRSYADELIDEVINNGGCEFDRDFATPFPVAIFLRLMRLPVERLQEFVNWVDDLFHPKTMEAHVQAIREVLQYLREVIAERKKDIGDDLLSAFLTAKVGDRSLTEDEILSFSFLVFQGGLDTVTATANFIFKHLAENQENQAILRREHGMMATALEELLRAFSVSPSLRIVVEDMEFHGVRMKKGDRILLATPISGRDERAYDAPNVIDFRRPTPQHLAFATGVHTCAGNGLARRELRIAIERWLTRVPTFRLDVNSPPVTHARLVYGVERLPLLWN